LRRFKIHAVIEHGLGAVQAHGLDAQPDLALSGLLGGKFIEVEVFRTPDSMKANDGWHNSSSQRSMNNKVIQVQIEVPGTRN
jgi:hypothetical protein